MKKNHYLLLIIVCLIITGLCGCTEQNDSPPATYSGKVINEEFLVNAAGGFFSTSGDEVLLIIPDSAVEDEMRLTVKTLQTFPADLHYHYVVGYEFGPSGTQLKKPVTIQIYYSESDVPASVDEQHLKICLYDSGALTEVEGCSAYPDYNYVEGQISHFSHYWVCSASSSSGTGGGSTNGSGSNTTGGDSAIYKFDVEYMEFIERHEKMNRSDWFASEKYSLHAYFIWDPSPYVRYYEVELHTNGTEPPAIKAGSWREMMYYSYGGDPQVRHREGDLYIFGEHKYYPGYGQYITIYDNYQYLFPDKHGFEIFSLHDNFDISDYSYSSVPEADVERYIQEMKEFFYNYIDGWTITVRAVS